jgi:hypothetical protein
MKNCISCNKQVKTGHGYKLSTKYCSYKCYQDKPPRVIEIESEFLSNIKDIIKESEAMDCSEVIKAYSLGINRGTYRRWKNKYMEVL